MDTNKEAFRRYLESAGVVDALTKGTSVPARPSAASLGCVLVSLYEEPDKPRQAVDYVKSCLGGPTPAEYEAVAAERDALKADLEEAQRAVAQLQAKVQALEAAKGA
ncbi:hypothetical protein Rsub_01072 [Raphidocelis subcapitata]|uniref:Uncharacterized protein n=1 Tax=Raphidocelis subcapitata TaxID=307507 RepID=A0A2V0NS13_9CHLO|nr:hypothetical protein Rsub_01072 [Raphidocelis subcapitata]|eukprot:GBF88360.1 hypothetical protein Rsub_01072 [Raphidocelis subcapitata]